MDYGRDLFPFTLADGTGILLGPVISEDRARIRDGVARMSGYSRYLRFFTGSPHLTDDLLTYLTEIDQKNHVAWCALEPAAGLPGIGLGRFVRLAEKPEIAEFALAVVDPWQRRNIGTILLAMLWLLARRDGVRTLRGLVLPENDVALAWFRNLGAAVQYRQDINEADLPVRDLSAFPPTASAGRFQATIRMLQEAWDVHRNRGQHEQ